MMTTDGPAIMFIWAAIWLLIVVVLILVGAAAIKYLFFDPRRRDVVVRSDLERPVVRTPPP